MNIKNFAFSRTSLSDIGVSAVSVGIHGKDHVTMKLVENTQEVWLPNSTKPVLL